MSARDSSNTHEVIGELFRAMNTKTGDRAAAGLPRWADAFPYVNGGLFSGSLDVPRFSRIARSYLLHIGGLDWTKINPDIFGSMIQAVAEDEERGALGMHYTSVPNILKVLNPLFLDDLRARLEEAGDNRPHTAQPAPAHGADQGVRPGLRLAAISSSSPIRKCGRSRRRSTSGAGEADRAREIPLTNFRGIELRDFPAEIARLALIIAEYQCDVLYRGQKEALAEFPAARCGELDHLRQRVAAGLAQHLPADRNRREASRRRPVSYAARSGRRSTSRMKAGRRISAGIRRISVSSGRPTSRKIDLRAIFDGRAKSLEVARLCRWMVHEGCGLRHAVPMPSAAFVSTNSICQGQQVPILWPLIFRTGHEIAFAHTSFKWANLASHNAGVTVVIVGISNNAGTGRALFRSRDDGASIARRSTTSTLIWSPAPNIEVEDARTASRCFATMEFGNKPSRWRSLASFELDENGCARADPRCRDDSFATLYGSQEFISSGSRALPLD